MEKEIHSANSWETANLGSSDRNDKFLRLMGAKKKEHHGRFIIGEQTSTAHGNASTESQKVSSKLEEQYVQSMDHAVKGSWKHQGLGFQEESTDPVTTDNVTSSEQGSEAENQQTEMEGNGGYQKEYSHESDRDRERYSDEKKDGRRFREEREERFSEDKDGRRSREEREERFSEDKDGRRSREERFSEDKDGRRSREDTGEKRYSTKRSTENYGESDNRKYSEDREKKYSDKRDDRSYAESSGRRRNYDRDEDKDQREYSHKKWKSDTKERDRSDKKEDSRSSLK